MAFIIDLAASLILSTTVFAMIYKLMPRLQERRLDRCGSQGTAVYHRQASHRSIPRKSGISSRFESAVSLVVLLLSVYHSAQVFLFRAEFTLAYSHKYGSRKGQLAN